ncbi:hypothetical protein [Moraxella lacunata]|uniref:hypothetical protein n=1 Tax=Moraxella lacunata TaxID=477 RepID=UPI003EE04FC5
MATLGVSLHAIARTMGEMTRIFKNNRRLVISFYLTKNNFYLTKNNFYLTKNKQYCKCSHNFQV